jgi:glycine/D-amino acid oxidase-like deaminating enzyme
MTTVPPFGSLLGSSRVVTVISSWQLSNRCPPPLSLLANCHKPQLLWRAEDAMGEAMRLLKVAEAAAAAEGEQLPVAWRHGVLRRSANLGQAAAGRKAWGDRSPCPQCGGGKAPKASGEDATADVMEVHCTSPTQVAALVPGVRLPAVEQAAAAEAATPSSSAAAWAQPASAAAAAESSEDESAAEGAVAAAAAAAAPPSPADAAACAGLHIPNGLTLHPARYMSALWAACQRRAAARGDGSRATLRVQAIGSVSELHAGAWGPFGGGVVVAAGAAVGSLSEFQGPSGQLPLDNCQGYTLDLAPPAELTAGDDAASGQQAAAAAAAFGGVVQFPAGAPSLLGTPYIASQAGQLLVVGATKSHGWSGPRALAECGRVIDAAAYQRDMAEAAAALTAARLGGGSSGAGEGSSPGHRDEVSAAVHELLEGGAANWPPLLQWRLQGVRTGVRALPPRTNAGTVPFMGRWSTDSAGDEGDEGSSESGSGAPPTWLYVGLGGRGLVYHAWLGRCAALAALSGSEEPLPKETLWWRRKMGK